jgi:hypothetical protein
MFEHSSCKRIVMFMNYLKTQCSLISQRSLLVWTVSRFRLFDRLYEQYIDEYGTLLE